MSEEPPVIRPDSEFTTYQKDKRNGGIFNIAFGVIFLAWSTCDLIADFDGWFSYADVFFVLTAICFIAYGVSQLRTEKKK